jgi:hypothetical protein
MKPEMERKYVDRLVGSIGLRTNRFSSFYISLLPTATWNSIERETLLIPIAL